MCGELASARFLSEPGQKCLVEDEAETETGSMDPVWNFNGHEYEYCSLVVSLPVVEPEPDMFWKPAATDVTEAAMSWTCAQLLLVHESPPPRGGEFGPPFC